MERELAEEEAAAAIRSRSKRWRYSASSARAFPDDDAAPPRPRSGSIESSVSLLDLDDRDFGLRDFIYTIACTPRGICGDTRR